MAFVIAPSLCTTSFPGAMALLEIELLHKKWTFCKMHHQGLGEVHLQKIMSPWHSSIFNEAKCCTGQATL